MSSTRRKRSRGRTFPAAGAGGSEAQMKGSERGEMCSSSRSAEVHTLYDLLGVSRDASPKEITTAYRRRALLCHPDKVHANLKKTKGEQCNDSACSVEEATKHFQKLQAAYAILSDPRRRKHYDRTGQTDSVELSGRSYEEAYEFYRGLFEEVTEAGIEKFKSSYIGSQEEKDDIRDYYNRHEGDLTNFFQYVPLSDPCDTPRYKEILERLLDDKAILETAAYKKTLPKFEGFGSKYTKVVNRETEDARKVNTKKRKTDRDPSALVLAIKANANRRHVAGADFLRKLEMKYNKENA